MSLEIHWRKKMILLFLFRLLFKDLDTLFKYLLLIYSSYIYSIHFITGPLKLFKSHLVNLSRRCISPAELERPSPVLKYKHELLIVMMHGLFFLVPPYINRLDIDVYPTVVENRTVIISCPADGLPSPIVKWLRNGEVCGRLKDL